MATILVSSLKRLYAAGRVTKEQIRERAEKGTITEVDYQEITGEAYEDE
ncbi:XkdX family protein [Anaerotruncus sp. 1XD22-93]|nr:XkdX family protein [Lachnospiraceae bacterium]NBI71694.1 XkdX family protein [Clostridiaceae bacterium]NBI75478.1 XkdX family protein [Lachnospiraceae bacterium]RKJ87079.1 XkdX family protein [Anaerotruncus sp. 1XD22-93]